MLPTYEAMIKNIDFETILPIWRDHLWPGRQSLIEPVSAIAPDGKIDLAIIEFKPYFFGMYDDEQLIGVCSCHRSSVNEMRVRGIWVHPQFRHRGVGSRLILQVLSLAKEEHILRLWAMARHSSADFYLRCGFKSYAETSAYEFGPHIFCDYQF